MQCNAALGEDAHEDGARRGRVQREEARSARHKRHLHRVRWRVARRQLALEPRVHGQRQLDAARPAADHHEPHALRHCARALRRCRARALRHVARAAQDRLPARRKPVYGLHGRDRRGGARAVRAPARGGARGARRGGELRRGADVD